MDKLKLKKGLKFLNDSAGTFLAITPIVGMIYIANLRADVKLEFREPLLGVWIFFIVFLVGGAIQLLLDIRRFRKLNNADKQAEKKNYQTNKFVKCLKSIFGNTGIYLLVASIAGVAYVLNLSSYVGDVSIDVEWGFYKKISNISIPFGVFMGLSVIQLANDIRRFYKQRKEENSNLLG
jgi:hypothetical protein